MDESMHLFIFRGELMKMNEEEYASFLETLGEWDD